MGLLLGEWGYVQNIAGEVDLFTLDIRHHTTDKVKNAIVHQYRGVVEGGIDAPIIGVIPVAFKDELLQVAGELVADKKIQNRTVLNNKIIIPLVEV